VPDGSRGGGLSGAPEPEFSHWTEAALLKHSARKGWPAPAGIKLWQEYQNFRCTVAVRLQVRALDTDAGQRRLTTSFQGL
jgi:hypothetical protein